MYHLYRLTGLNLSVFQIKTKIVSCRTADSKSVKQEVNSTAILPPMKVTPAVIFMLLMLRTNRL
jgi:hypothetical protein